MMEIPLLHRLVLICQACRMVSARTAVRLTATLVDSEPRIWRRLEVDASMTLDQVHLVLQTAFDWQDAHLHLFSDEDPDWWMSSDDVRRVPTRWGSESDIFDGIATQRETNARLGDVLTVTSRPLLYEYDAGDGWTHLLEFNDLVAARAEVPGAILLDGERRGPLEDSGGISGYMEKLAILADPSRPEHGAIAAWVSSISPPWRPFRPDEVAFDAINAELRALFPAALDRPSRTTTLDQRLLAKIPNGLRRDFRAYLSDAVSGGPDIVDDATAERMVRPYQWLIRRIGMEGVALSAAGWMPGQLVTDAMRELDWGWRWYGLMNRESHTAPVRHLRETAMRFGLLRKLKGRLVLSVAARACLDDPHALWKLLAAGIANSRDDEVTRDAVALLMVEVAAGRMGDSRSDSGPIPYGLGVLGWRDGESWGAISADTAHDLTLDTSRALDFIDVYVRGEGPLGGSIGVTDGGRAFARAVLHSVVR
jgi:hypothetical protein